jgi:hypothetical protein
MTNEQFLDEVYKNYNELFDSYYPPFSAPYPKRLTREEVFNKCKNDPVFVEEYGLQIEERELSEQERMDLYDKSNWNKDIFPSDVSGWNRLLDGYNIPTKVISLTYNDKTIETYYDGRIK